MMSCCILCCVLFGIQLASITNPVSADPDVHGRFNQTAALPCGHKCPGLAKWTPSSNPDVVLAECDQASCRSVKEGFTMSHDQYLEGDLTLTITAADYSMRGLYTCQCDGRDVNDVRLTIKKLLSSVQLKPGEDLLLDLHISKQVAVIYNHKHSDDEEICTVDRSSLQCTAEYTPRTSVTHTLLTLRAVTHSDAGVYTVRDKVNNEDLHIYTVFVEAPRPHGAVMVSVSVLVGLVVGGIVVALCVKILHRRKQTQQQGALNSSEREYLRNDPSEDNSIPLNNTWSAGPNTTTAQLLDRSGESGDFDSQVASGADGGLRSNDPTAAAQVNGQVAELTQQPNIRGAERPCHRRSYSDSQLLELISLTEEVTKTGLQPNCILVAEELRRKVEVFGQRHSSLLRDQNTICEHFQKDLDNLNMIEEWSCKTKEKLTQLINQYDRKAGKGHKRGASDTPGFNSNHTHYK